MADLLHGQTSAYQAIALYREDDGSLSLTLDDYWQFSTRDEHIFHEVLADVPLVLAPDPRRVLILGGGDGLALRNVLRYPDVEHVVLCELDPAVIEMTRTLPEMIALTDGATSDPRTKIVIQDAVAYLPEAEGTFDVIICDFPVPTSPELEGLFAAPFYEQVGHALAPGGVVSVQVSLEPAGYWPVLAALESALGPAEGRLVQMADGAWASFVLAGRTGSGLVRPLAAEVRFLKPALVDALVIRNRGGSRFSTAAYGDQPDFETG